MPLRTNYNFPIRKRLLKNSKSENCDPKEKNVKVKLQRTLFQSNSSPKKLKIHDENSSIKKCNLEPAKPNVSSFTLTKQAFHTGLPTRLIGRSDEIFKINTFLCDHIETNSPGSMYISGAPGTGKTSCLNFVFQNLQKNYKFAFINCMTVCSPAEIYKNIAYSYDVSCKGKKFSTSLEKHITCTNTMHVLVLDEIDHLDSKGQKILYELFEWPQLKNSKLILIGIANALDLTDRVLPRLQAFCYQPHLIHFQPYTKNQIVSILEDRLREVQSDGLCVIKPMAIQLCARKIAACTGDIRKALDVCRRSIEIVENKFKKQLILRPISDDRRNPGSPMKSQQPVKFVDIEDISAVLHEVYGSKLQTSNVTNDSKTVTMPLQHMILLCTIILMRRHCKPQDLTLGKVYIIYKRICMKREIADVGECSFPGLCRLVESRGFIELKQAKIPRMSKINLKIEDSEAEHVIQDKAMLPSILADSSVLSAQ